MTDHWVDYRSKENIRPVEIPDRDKFFRDIQNIEDSFSGRMDAGSIINTFIMESAQLLMNSLVLFEQGYFDAAYYSLRSAVDVSTTMVYLIDIPDEEREEKLSAWKETREFPTQGRLIKYLSTNGNIYRDMREKMPQFFSDAKELTERLNKYVHKQGFRHFYIARNHPLYGIKSQDTFIQSYVHYLKRCIGVVAVMRLAADPFPVLLMDKDILYRCFDSITDPYSDSFVEEYIGKETIDAYKKTDMYTGTYDSFINDEEKNEATFNVMKYQIIDTTKREELLSQLYLLSVYDVVCVVIAFSCNKAVKLYTFNGLMMYYTDKKTNRTATHWGGKDFHNFAHNEKKYNQPYDEAYISVFHFRQENYFVEHNEALDDVDINNIKQELESLDAAIPKNEKQMEEE